MNIKNLNDSISISLTLTILLTTAITFIMDPRIFPEGVGKVISSYYGLSIVFLLLIYVFLQFNFKSLSDAEIIKYTRYILFTLILNTTVLLFLMYPMLINLGITLVSIAIATGYNIAILSVLILIPLIWRTIFSK